VQGWAKNGGPNARGGGAGALGGTWGGGIGTGFPGGQRMGGLRSKRCFQAFEPRGLRWTAPGEAKAAGSGGPVRGRIFRAFSGSVSHGPQGRKRKRERRKDNEFGSAEDLTNPFSGQIKGCKDSHPNKGQRGAVTVALQGRTSGPGYRGCSPPFEGDRSVGPEILRDQAPARCPANMPAPP